MVVSYLGILNRSSVQAHLAPVCPHSELSSTSLAIPFTATGGEIAIIEESFQEKGESGSF